MSSGALMFLFPVFRISWLQVIEAISVGAFVSILLIFTTKFEVKDDEIYLKPSRSFIFILFGLFFLRLILKMILAVILMLRNEWKVFFSLIWGVFDFGTFYVFLVLEII